MLNIYLGTIIRKGFLIYSAEELQRFAKSEASYILKAFDVEIPKTGRV